MGALALALKSIKGHSTRSLIVFLCVFGVAVFFVSTTLIIRGADKSVHKGLDRLGADILVVPSGSESKVETALLTGTPANAWMSSDYVQKIAAVQGVVSVSPQIYLQTLYGASCCSLSETFLVVFDASTDFTIRPWLEKNLGRDLSKGEVIGGDFISIPPGEIDIKLYGYPVKLIGHLERTGTGLDQTIFMNAETAHAIAESSKTTAKSPLEIPEGQISAVMVKVEQDANVHKVALQTMWDIPGVFPIESPQIFGTVRNQMLGLLWVFLAVISIVWVLSIIFIGFIFSMATNERRREMAVLRALGATRFYIFRTLVAESMLLVFIAGVLGITLASFVVFMFKEAITHSLKMPFLYPSFTFLIFLLLIGVLISLITVAFSTFIPAYRISTKEPALMMRE